MVLDSFTCNRKFLIIYRSDFYIMSAKKVILSADSSCDIGPELKEKYDIPYFRFHILMDGGSYLDGLDLSSSDIFSTYREKKCLPKTSAINVNEYYEEFKKWTDQGFEVVHINLSSAISCAYQNCCAAAAELPGVYPVDSRNLSTGMGQLVIEAAKMAGQGMSAEQIQAEVRNLIGKVQVNFILDTLEFMCAGGRCSVLTALGANILKLKPCIEVDNASGAMYVGKKYRGNLDKVAIQYAKERFADVDSINPERLFITHTLQSRELLESVYQYIRGMNIFKEIYITDAGCTISSHCGPNTLGLVYMKK